jgi:hypothetical protein
MTNDAENGHGYSPVGMFCPAEVCAKTEENNTTCARQRHDINTTGHYYSLSALFLWR